MTKQVALLTILVISICGILFSGYLSYQELFAGKACKKGCTAIKILSLPPCIYGLVMYTVVFLVALLGYQADF